MGGGRGLFIQIPIMAIYGSIIEDYGHFGQALNI
jgi:hypothetical protein